MKAASSGMENPTCSTNQPRDEIRRGKRQLHLNQGNSDTAPYPR